MIHFPALRWGEPYQSLEVNQVAHFATGEPLAEVSQANGGLVARDLRKAQRARDVLREIPCAELVKMVKRAGQLFQTAELPVGDASQSPDDFVRQQSATTGLPEQLCRMNMEKLVGVLAQLDRILDALTRRLDLDIFTKGFGDEDGVLRSYQAAAPVLGMVLPSNSPGVHSLWLPVVPLQVGLVLKPGPQEPWTPWRLTQAFFEAGVPKQAIALYPGEAEVGAAVVNHCPRSFIFGGTATVDRYRGNPAVQVHGPGFSKILIGDDQVDDWEQHLDLMVQSVALNSGRSCINCSGIWASRHTKEIAAALAERLGPIAPLPPDDPKSELAAFTVPGQAEAISGDIDAAIAEDGVEDATASYHEGGRLTSHERYGYLRPTVLRGRATSAAAAKEYMFPFVTVVECPQAEMIGSIGSTLVATGITQDDAFRQSLMAATNIDRLNLGPIPTTRLNWLQPHEGNIVDFLFRARAFQMA
ncbi:MAG: aldehyde dehydrogenase family protein [Vicinamibacterales bacterium]|nr:aldehyde dehydrogenase [Acidobacteriota bacterium]MDP6371006.1 aldehyde dehydrogenase family protein [Vicinamibacterales bacterium]MDP6609166.1 aldehyde dehydrogenase family protein [Vicinamibacterales bacterium]HAK57131.1 aldehyde dehydrogenase [Acidobacteriota bacterium]